MALEHAATVESFGESQQHHRLYIPKDIRTDSDYPLAAGLDVQLRVVGPCVLVVPQRRSSLVETVADVIEKEVL
ncbi:MULTISPECIES: hypothetical protein [Salinibaculum]|uniref:hypothetical protein n=1 Tax=Salinibaculum TaxID=2732368 RepID=UPI0030CC3078